MQRHKVTMARFARCCLSATVVLALTGLSAEAGFLTKSLQATRVEG
jgi:hypothetical protein